MSQPLFARLLGISEKTLQNWEQGRHKPTGPAKVLLKVAARHPELLLETLKYVARLLRNSSPITQSRAATLRGFLWEEP